MRLKSERDSFLRKEQEMQIEINKGRHNESEFKIEKETLEEKLKVVSKAWV